MSLRLPASPAQSLLRKMISAGLHAADPYQALLGTVIRNGDLLRVRRRAYDLAHFDRVIAVGAGKASARMAQGLEHILGTRLNGGLVVVKTGHRLPTKRITIVEAGHPIPDRAGLRAAEQLRTLIQDLTPRDLLLVLLSGGASSLLPAPVPGVTLGDKQLTTQLLLKSGATIQEMNVVRKHLSSLKGGRLAASTRATIITLILSDVLGDDLGSIGSGPTAPDPTTFTDAITVLQQHKLWRAIPTAVRHHLLKGRKGAAPETLKPGSRRLRSVHHEIIGNNSGMLDAVTRVARETGLRTLLFSTALTGEAHEAARQFVHLAGPIATGTKVLRRPCCLIAGGETTVTVTGRGKGGRAQEFAASAAIDIDGLPNVWVAAVGTDGTDGPTDVAGAVVSGETVARAKKLGVNLCSALRRHDTYSALKALRCHIRTGPTGTNVNDLYLLLLL
ncbi:MAG: glycerate kinase [Nitrospirae bacterium]|nr:glycerate kinase [Nitrospirota bacterium]